MPLVLKNDYLRFAPPILSFRLLPEKKERAAPGVRKKRAARKWYTVLRHAVRGYLAYARAAA